MIERKQLRIGSRASPLALAQAYCVREKLMMAHNLPEEAFTIRTITTRGDKSSRNESESGAARKGFFTKEIEDALLNNEIDMAIHSSKDMSTLLPARLCIAAFLEREDPRDVFIGRVASCLDTLASGAIIGSSSFRRQALLRSIKPDLKVVPFRGNVDTRLQKLAEGKVDGIILAFAGLKRLGLAHRASQILDLERFPPAPGQGAICIECREEDTKMLEFLAPVNHQPTAYALTCERSFLRMLNGSCRTPIAGYAVIKNDILTFSGVLIGPDRIIYKTDKTGSLEDASQIGSLAACDIRKAIGSQFFENWQNL